MDEKNCNGENEAVDKVTGYKLQTDNYRNSVFIKLVRIEDDAELLLWIANNLKTDIDINTLKLQTMDNKHCRRSVRSKCRLKAREMCKQIYAIKDCKNKITESVCSKQRPDGVSEKSKNISRVNKRLPNKPKPTVKQSIKQKLNRHPLSETVLCAEIKSSDVFDTDDKRTCANRPRRTRTSNDSRNAKDEMRPTNVKTSSSAIILADKQSDDARSEDIHVSNSHLLGRKNGNNNQINDSLTNAESTSDGLKMKCNSKDGYTTKSEHVFTKDCNDCDVQPSKRKVPGTSIISLAENINFDFIEDISVRHTMKKPSSFDSDKIPKENEVCRRCNASTADSSTKESESTAIRTIYDVMNDIAVILPSWNLHILPDTNTFCIGQITRNKSGIPHLSKCIELDDDFNAKVYICEQHRKKFDGIYDSENTVTELISVVHHCS